MNPEHRILPELVTSTFNYCTFSPTLKLLPNPPLPPPHQKKVSGDPRLRSRIV